VVGVVGEMVNNVDVLAMCFDHAGFNECWWITPSDKVLSEDELFSKYLRSCGSIGIVRKGTALNSTDQDASPVQPPKNNTRQRQT
jgi:hypothetical protein